MGGVAAFSLRSSAKCFVPRDRNVFVILRACLVWFHEGTSVNRTYETCVTLFPTHFAHDVRSRSRNLSQRRGKQLCGWISPRF